VIKVEHTHTEYLSGKVASLGLSATAGKDNEKTVRVCLLWFVKMLILEQGCIIYIRSHPMSCQRLFLSPILREQNSL